LFGHVDICAQAWGSLHAAKPQTAQDCGRIMANSPSALYLGAHLHWGRAAIKTWAGDGVMHAEHVKQPLGDLGVDRLHIREAQVRQESQPFPSASATGSRHAVDARRGTACPVPRRQQSGAKIRRGGKSSERNSRTRVRGHVPTPIPASPPRQHQRMRLRQTPASLSSACSFRNRPAAAAFITVQQRHIGPEDRPILAADQLGGIGVLLLGGFDRRTGWKKAVRTRPRKRTGPTTNHQLSFQQARRCMAQMVALRDQEPPARSRRSDTASSEFAIRRSKPSAACRHLAVNREARARPMRLPPRATRFIRARAIGENASGPFAEHLERKPSYGDPM